MTVRTQLDGETTKIRFSLPQLCAIVGAVMGAGFVVGGGLYAIKADIAVVTKGFNELKVERTESLREWQRWREGINSVNARQDYRLDALETRTVTR